MNVSTYNDEDLLNEENAERQIQNTSLSIAAAIPKLKPYFSIVNIKNFLSTFNKNYEYSYLQRLVAWLFSFNLISGDINQFNSQILCLLNNYISILKNVKETMCSIGVEKEKIIKEMSAIEGDTKRTIKWYFEIINGSQNSEKVESERYELILKRVNKILLTCIIEDKDYQNPHYVQGEERYVYAIHYLVQRFADEYNLPILFLEAITFFVSSEMIKLSNIQDIIKNGKEIRSFFNDIDMQITSYLPEMADMLTKNRLTSYHFALRWRLLLFIDEYNDIGDLFLIWDHLIHHKEDSKRFVKCLILAHLLQVVPENEVLFIKKLQNFKKWDIQSIINDSEKFYRNMFMYSKSFEDGNKNSKEIKNEPIHFVIRNGVIIDQDNDESDGLSSSPIATITAATAVAAAVATGLAIFLKHRKK